MAQEERIEYRNHVIWLRSYELAAGGWVPRAVILFPSEEGGGEEDIRRHCGWAGNGWMKHWRAMRHHHRCAGVNQETNRAAGLLWGHYDGAPEALCQVAGG